MIVFTRLVTGEIVVHVERCFDWSVSHDVLLDAAVSQVVVVTCYNGNSIR